MYLSKVTANSVRWRNSKWPPTPPWSTVDYNCQSHCPHFYFFHHYSSSMPEVAAWIGEVGAASVYLHCWLLILNEKLLQITDDFLCHWQPRTTCC